MHCRVRQGKKKKSPPFWPMCYIIGSTLFVNKIWHACFSENDNHYFEPVSVAASDWNRHCIPWQTDQWCFSGSQQRTWPQKWGLKWPYRPSHTVGRSLLTVTPPNSTGWKRWFCCLDCLSNQSHLYPQGTQSHDTLVVFCGDHRGVEVTQRPVSTGCNRVLTQRR